MRGWFIDFFGTAFLEMVVQGGPKKQVLTLRDLNFYITPKIFWIIINDSLAVTADK